MEHTLILKNANVLDPTAATVEKRTLYIADGKLVDALPEAGLPVLDLSGCYISPGFLDSHVHVFEKHAAISIPADQVGIQQGVLTVVDAGSVGIRDFSIFEKEIIHKNQTDIRFFLNIARCGLCDDLSELMSPDRLMTYEELANFQKIHGSQMVGLKVRMSGSVVKNQGIKPLLHGRHLSEQSGLPLMVHIGNEPPELGLILNTLQKGDIVTHCFHGKPGGFSACPKEFKAAAERGVQFDVGHGSASFSYRTVTQVMGIQKIDFSISTDLYDKNYTSPVGSLMDTMSKFFPLDYQLVDLVRRVTVLPRQMLGLPPANIQPGCLANLTIFRVVKQTKDFIDSENELIRSHRYLQPVAALIQGKKVWSNEL